MSTNNPSPEPRLRQLFLAALDITNPNERERFLADACGQDQPLRQQLDQLMAQHKDDSFLEHPAVDPNSAATVLKPPRNANSSPATQSTTLHYFGDYELLEEIARGGMGVVWKARQTSLNRAVAVKMILGGQLATEGDVKRFHTEAEAAANLKHPNIVAIHEIGEHEGRHYFSMDLIEGKNLAQMIGGEPMPPQKAASLMKTLAEAVHYAHQRGTLHRDLKPQNVLMDAEGQPHITDFGLAKQMAGQSEFTQSGTVMGSPSYMPPEQALGKQGEIGPASDVYSLGAVLYQMLAGKPPFSGATAVDTLRQVIEQEPVALSKLNPNVPSDLETICLKCLEKKSERRYASARVLAEELNRFLNHEPILAKPASAGRKTWNWLVRHPWALTGAASMLVLGLIGLAYGLWEQNQALKWSVAQGRPASAAKVHNEFTVRTGWWFLAIIMNGLVLVPGLFADFVDRKRRNLVIAMPHLRTYALVASVEILVALAFALNLIHDHVWNGFRVEDLMMWFVKVVSPVWFGALMLWHVVKQMRATTFGVAYENAETIFQPKRDHFTVEQYRAVSVLLLCLATILLAGTVLKSVALGVTGFWSVIATTLLLSYRRDKTAGRSLALLMGGFLAVGIVIMCMQAVRSVIYDPHSPLENRVTKEWTATIGAVLGAIGAGLAFRWNSRHVGHTPALASRRIWPAYHFVAERAMIVGGMPLGGWAALPFLCLLWRASQGAERRAYGMTIGTSAMFLAIFHFLLWGGWDNPLKQILGLYTKAGLISFGLGCFGVVIFHFLERTARIKMSAAPK